jgi:hypothetical protein
MPNHSEIVNWIASRRSNALFRMSIIQEFVAENHADILQLKQTVEMLDAIEVRLCENVKETVR